MRRKKPTSEIQFREPVLIPDYLEEPRGILDESLWEKTQKEEDDEKLLRLCRHYEIVDSPNMYKKLALALAREFLAEPKKRGNRAKWNEFAESLLVVDFERHNPSGDIPLAKIAEKLLTERPWKHFISHKEGSWTKDQVTNLTKRYSKFKSDWRAQSMREAYKLRYAEDNLEDEWVDFVEDFLRCCKT